MCIAGEFIWTKYGFIQIIIFYLISSDFPFFQFYAKLG